MERQASGDQGGHVDRAEAALKVELAGVRARKIVRLDAKVEMLAGRTFNRLGALVAVVFGWHPVRRAAPSLAAARMNRHWLTRPSTWIDVIQLVLIAAMLVVDAAVLVN